MTKKRRLRLNLKMKKKMINGCVHDYAGPWLLAKKPPTGLFARLLLDRLHAFYATDRT